MCNYRRSRALRRCIRCSCLSAMLTTLLLFFFFNFWQDLSYRVYLSTLNIRLYKDSITLWSTDFHISPIQDLKAILIPLGVSFFDKSLSYSCVRTKTCASHLRVLTQINTMRPTNTTIRQFYEFYKDQPEMNLVDAFVCFHPAAMCELYMPFNRTIIVIATTRYELWRFEPPEWMKLNENLKTIAQDPKNVIAANNLYDVEYIRYFTGLNATLLPSLCNYTNTAYRPTRSEFLLAPIHAPVFDTYFRMLLTRSLTSDKTGKIQVVPIRNIYSNYQYSDLATHPAIIHVPYQVSVMSLFEQYRMNIPLVFPSLDLLTRWHAKYGVVNEKTWDQALHGEVPHRSRISGVLRDVPDPNNDRDLASIRYWLNLSDFYQWPHITYFESTDDLVRKLSSTDFGEVSKKMEEYNAEVGRSLGRKWKSILDNIKRYSKKFRRLESEEQET